MSQSNKFQWSGLVTALLLIIGLFISAFIFGSLKSGALIIFIFFEIYLFCTLWQGLKSGEFTIGNYGLVKHIRKNNNPYDFWFTALLTVGIMLFIAFKVYVNWEYIL